MDKKEKLEMLQKLSEARLTEEVLIRLFEKMGFKDIKKTHGMVEQGLDLVFYKENEFIEREYTGVQVKAVKIHGAAGKEGNATEILTQAQQAFATSFIDIYDGKSKKIDRFIVVTSHEITKSSEDSIKDQLIGLGTYKTITFIDGTKLVVVSIMALS